METKFTPRFALMSLVELTKFPKFECNFSPVHVVFIQSTFMGSCVEFACKNGFLYRGQVINVVLVKR